MFSLSRRSTWCASAALVASALASAGCGTARSADERNTCELRAEANAAADVARRAFNDGKLTRAQLARFLRRDHGYLDASGKLRPATSLHGQTRWDFERWVAAVETTVPKVGDRMYAARLRVRKHGAPGC